jgi:transposase
VVDVSTLTRTVRELQASNVKLRHAVLDAGYYSNANIQDFYDSGISFLTRLNGHWKDYKELLSTRMPDLTSYKNIVIYNGRCVYIKRVKHELIKGYPGYAYIALDKFRQADENTQFVKRLVDKDEPYTKKELASRLERQGMFILVSNNKLKIDEVLPLYYTRRQIEQVFDIGKNYANLIPLRIHSEETFRGHLLLTFIAIAIIRMMRLKLNDTRFNPISLFLELRNHKSKVYPDRVITCESFKIANDYYKLFNMTCPLVLPI